MIRVLALVIPLALAGSISPVMLTEQTVLLAGRNGRRVAGSYAIGVAGTLLVLLSALVLFGHVISLPQEPRLSAGLDVLLGSLLVLIAAVLRWRRPRRSDSEKAEESKRPGLTPIGALGFGIFSMATNFTTLAVMVPVAKEIAASDLEVLERAVVVAVVVVLGALPAWLPVALTAVAPGPTSRGLKALSAFIERRGRLATVLLLAAVGLFLIGRGVVHTLGW